MKTIKKWIAVILISLICCQITQVNVFAAGMSASANKSSVTIGSSFNVTVSASDCAAFDIVVSTNNGSVSGGSSSLDTEGQSGSKSTTFKITPSQVGSCVVTVKGVYAGYSGNTTDVGFSKTITVIVSNKATTSNSNTAPATTPTVDNRSKDNALSSLTVSEGKLSPDFSASTTKYTLNLDGSHTKITVDAKAKDSKAKVSGTGEKTLDVGDNEINIKCTAENGSTQTYTIIVHVDETPTNFSEFQGQKLGVVKNLKDVKVPTNFDEATTKLNDEEITAWYSKNLKLTLCYLMNEAGEKDFYIIEDGKIMTQYKVIKANGKNYVVLSVDDDMKDRKGFTYQEVMVEENKLNGWSYNDKTMESYVQVYLMNESGEKHIYDYELTENQLQIYTEMTQPSQGIDIFMITTILFAGLSGGLLYMYLNFKKKSISAIKEYYDKKQ